MHDWPNSVRAVLFAAGLTLWTLPAAAAGDPGDRASAPADRGKAPAGIIHLDETVISGNQELPKVLYIVPWRQPDGLPDIELKTDFGETELFRPLYPPAYRRELKYAEAVRANSQPKTGDSKE